MGGIRRSTVHFEQLPSKAKFKNSLDELTGLALCFDEEFEDVLEVVHPTRPKVAVAIYWVDKDISQVLDALRGLGIDDRQKYSLHEKRAVCINVELEAGNIDYLEKSALYLLKQLGGRSEEDMPLPNWAGKKWADVWPRSHWGQLKASWYGWTRGTLSID